MIDVDFVIKNLGKSEKVISKCKNSTDWMDVSESLLSGDLKLLINGFDFGVRDNYIVAATDQLVLAIDSLIFYEDEVLFGYPERPQDIRLSRDGQWTNISREIKGEIQYETCVDTLFLCREVGRFSQRVVCKMLDEFPELMENQALMSPECPHIGIHLYNYRLKAHPSLMKSPFEKTN